MKNGFYKADYTGPFGSGSATFGVQDGQVMGTGVAGGQYIGGIIFNAQTGRYDLTLQLKAPPGVPLVTDGRAHSADEMIPITLSLTESDLGKPINLQTVTGPVTVTIHYLGESSHASAA